MARNVKRGIDEKKQPERGRYCMLDALRIVSFVEVSDSVDGTRR